jgi:hypothetical protein
MILIYTLLKCTAQYRLRHTGQMNDSMIRRGVKERFLALLFLYEAKNEKLSGVNV